MYFQIRELILWPKKPDLEPRRVKFQPGKVNVISGASKTGKSAIVPIIDYCLGSARCAIPTGTIRNACAWFGILVDTSEGQKLIARQEPGEQQQTGNMLLVEGAEVAVPDRITQHTANADQVRSMLNRLAGTSDLAFDPERSTAQGRASGFSARPSIRDFMAFVFQPQNVVANPDVLFFKADTSEHREKLKTIFPYVLGAVTPQTLMDRWELELLTKDLRRKERELQNIREVSQRWQSEARSWLNQARELGLFSADVPVPREWPELVDTLRGLARTNFGNARPDAASINEALSETLRLIEEERQLAAELFELRSRVNDLKSLKDAASSFGAALQIQKERLSLSTWLKGLAGPESQDSAIAPAIQASGELDELCAALAKIEEEVVKQPTSTETIDRELTRLNDQLREKIEAVEALRVQIKGREGVGPNSADGDYSIPDIERFLGRLEQALSTYETIGTDSDLSQTVETLRQQVEELSRRVSERNIQGRIDRALAQVHNIAASIIPKLDAEFPDHPIRLSIKDLSIQVIGPEREDWLWEIGSGANWLTYHVAVSAALQRFFMGDAQHPVPHLLIYDQPSQVYFPRSLVGDQPEPSWKDEDVKAVQKVFVALSDEVALSKGRLQVIVLDHAGAEVWGGTSHTHLVDEWRGGKKLVPEEWINGD